LLNFQPSTFNLQSYKSYPKADKLIIVANVEQDCRTVGREDCKKIWNLEPWNNLLLFLAIIPDFFLF